MDNRVYTVTEINKYLKKVLDSNPYLSGIYIQGEISNYKRYPSGHHYFSLKDSGGVLKCVMFSSDAFNLKFVPENGLSVVAFGRISVYPRDGQYQLYITSLIPAGVGSLTIAFEQLKEKLQKEGLFEASHKKELPRFPSRIVLVTSPAGAAVRDMLRILRARWPIASVMIAPVKVQGQGPRRKSQRPSKH